MKEIFFAIVIGSAAHFAVRAQEAGEISTDRPDYTEATDTILPGLMQLESGFLLSRHALASTPQHQVGAPYSLFRLRLPCFALGSLVSPNCGSVPTDSPANRG